jgi:hypothetical protein
MKYRGNECEEMLSAVEKMNNGEIASQIDQNFDWSQFKVKQKNI